MRKMIFAWILASICVSADAEIQPGTVPPDSLGKTPSGDPVSLASMRDKVVGDAKYAHLGELSSRTAQRNGSRKIGTSQTLSVRSRAGSLHGLAA
jgi:hypothetical protein